jgi:mevalonate kinase
MTDGDPIPSASLPIAARSPGKCVLFGEHAVVYGGPELVMAIDVDVQIGIRAAATTRLNGDAAAAARHPYLRAALEQPWAGRTPLEITVSSRLPRAAGLGSSAAFTAGLAAALGAARGGVGRAELAQRAFAVERAAQGVGSPGDTSAVVAGGYVTLNGPDGETLWTVTDGTRLWTVRRVQDPSWVWVLGSSGVARSTATAVRAVGERLAAPDGPALLARFREVALRGIAAVGREDRDAVGSALQENQRLLEAVGVSHPRLDRLLSAVAPVSEGAKLTGAGAGGSIVALPKPGREAEAVRRIQSAGGVPFVVRVPRSGARLVEAR